jgi:hypothetical protein
MSIYKVLALIPGCNKPDVPAGTLLYPTLSKTRKGTSPENDNRRYESPDGQHSFWAPLVEENKEYFEQQPENHEQIKN